jgi:hypothetical protein
LQRLLSFHALDHRPSQVDNELSDVSPGDEAPKDKLTQSDCEQAVHLASFVSSFVESEDSVEICLGNLPSPSDSAPAFDPRVQSARLNAM